MADMREALRKAGLLSEKEIRQAKHRDRVRRKELGKEGIEAERREKEQRFREEQERKRREDQERQRLLEQQKAEEARRAALERLITEGDLLAREGGPRRFYFATKSGRISFLDVSDRLASRLIQGDAAIVECRGWLKREFTAVPGKVAVEIERLDPSAIVSWNARR